MYLELDDSHFRTFVSVAFQFLMRYKMVMSSAQEKLRALSLLVCDFAWLGGGSLTPWLFALVMGFVGVAEAAPKAVLFVGNSFTSYHDMPQMVAALARASGESLEMDVVTSGGGSLEDHYQDKSGWPMRTLKSRKWNFVILQDHSLKLVESSASFVAYGPKWAEAAKGQGASPILFVPWSKKSLVKDQARLDEAHAQLGKTLNAKLAPVGPVWAKVLAEMPDTPLYDQDGNHPTSLGQYVTALVLYAAIYGKSPVGLPAKLSTNPRGGAPKELVDFSGRPKEIARMQQIAGELALRAIGK